MHKLKHPQYVISSITLFLLLLWITNFILVVFIYQTNTDQCLWTAEDEGMRITQIAAGGVVDKAGIIENDLLLKIDDQVFETPNAAQNYINSIPLDQKVKYTIKRGDEIFEVEFLLTTQSSPAIFMGIIGFVFLLVGYVVVINNPSHKISRMYFYLSLNFFLVFLFNNIPKAVPVYSIISRVVQVASIMLWGPLFLHFFMIFPQKVNLLKKKPKLIYLFYIPSIVIIGSAFAFRVIGQLFNVLIIIYTVVAISVFINSCRKIKDHDKRKPLRIILWGLIFGMIPLLILLPLANFFANLFGLASVMIILCSLTLFPIFFGYAVMKYGLMDVTVIIKKSLIYSMVTGIFILLYMVVVIGLGGVLAQKLGLENQIINLFFIAIVALAFNPAKNRIQKFVDKKFYREQYDFQKALLELSQELPTLIKLDEILNRVSSTLQRTLHIEKIAINLFEPSEKSYKNYSLTGLDNIENYDFKNKKSGLVGLLALKKRCIKLYQLDVNDDVKSIDNKEIEMIKKAGIALAVPMFNRQILRGMIQLGPKMSGEIYTQEDMDLLTTVAGQSAIAIENARLHLEELNRHKIEEELKMARTIQQSLLPEYPPELPGLEVAGCSISALEVGGDYFDYIQRDDTQLLVFVGDVSGKGMPAALYMSKVQGMIQISSALIQSPKEILKVVNHKITEGIDKKSFITMIAVLFDLNNKKATTCRAGHNPLFLRKSEKNDIEVIHSNGLGLGLVKGNKFNKNIEEISIPFKTNDYFVLYSDGLSEAMNPAKEEFGDERIIDIISNNNYSSAIELRDILIDETNKFRQDAEQNDDITIVIVKIK